MQLDPGATPSVLIGDNTEGKVTIEKPGKSSDDLPADNLLLAEFNYAASTAQQTLTDRGHIFDRYLLIAGSVFAAGVGAIYQLSRIR